MLLTSTDRAIATSVLCQILRASCHVLIRSTLFIVKVNYTTLLVGAGAEASDPTFLGFRLRSL
eukprot:6210695-Pleurochrysis_carterae.AAC.3